MSYQTNKEPVGIRRKYGRSTLVLKDQLFQAVVSLLERPGRTLLSTSLVALGAALLVIVVSLGASAERQVTSRFDALRATVVQVNAAGAASQAAPSDGESVALSERFPPDAAERLNRLTNVVSAGSLLVRATTADVHIGLPDASAGPDLVGDRLIYADPGLASAADLGMTGRWLSQTDVDAGRMVAVLGRLAADRLGLTRAAGSIIVDGVWYSLVGIVETSPLRPDVLDSVIMGRPLVMPPGVDVTQDSAIIVRSLPGAAQQVADQVAIQLLPSQPDLLEATAPDDPAAFREALEGDTRAVMEAFAAAGGGLGMLATLLVWWSSVSARRGAIGLWRAMGASRAHVFRLIITECLVGGGIAGIVGACAGVITVAVICLGRDWQLILNPWLIPSTIVGTTFLGGIAGSLPAWQATRLDPVDSLRSA